jgi:hypothetical protein
MVSNISHIDDDVIHFSGIRICYSLRITADHYWYKNWVYCEIPSNETYHIHVYCTEEIVINGVTKYLQICSLSKDQHFDIMSTIRKRNLDKIING